MPTSTANTRPAQDALEALQQGFANGHEHGTTEDVKVYRSFDDMPVDTRLLRGIYSHGFEKPSPIQQRAIVPMLKGGDIIGQAQAGTGKTGAFCVGLLGRIDTRRCETQALLLSPTRELAEQNYDVLCGLGAYLVPEGSGGLLAQLVVGGTRRSDDLAQLQARPPLAVVGTPGRLSDLIERGAIRVAGVRCIVLDEADQMLSQGFCDQVHRIFSFLPKNVQVALFSATLPSDVLQLSEKFMRDPTRILVRQEAMTLDRVKQYYVALSEADKVLCLADLYEQISVAQSVVFVNGRAKVDRVTAALNAEQHTVSSLHAELPRADRTAVMKAFRAGQARVLVTSDLVSRGIDVQHVNVVVNFDFPLDVETYLHRVGRSGRYLNKGIAISFVTPHEVTRLRAVEAHYKIRIEELPEDFATYLLGD